MMPRRLIILIALLLASGLAACATSPPVHLVTLHVVPNGTPATKAGGRPAIAVGRISLPPELDRSELVRRTGDNTLNVDPLYRWAAPLDVLVQRTLASDLASRLPNRLVVLPGEPDPPGRIDVLVIIFRIFSLDAENRVLLGARWTLANGQSKDALVTDDVRFTIQAASSSSADVAEAMSTALAKLSDAIATALAAAAS
jgi:uncharacterized lipoprotein YmbA